MARRENTIEMMTTLVPVESAMVSGEMVLRFNQLMWWKEIAVFDIPHSAQ